MSTTKINSKMRPFDNRHFIGYVNQVTPEHVSVHIPSSNLLSLYHNKGEKMHPGLVGSYVAIEGEEFGFIGRILELHLSEKERLDLTERNFENEEFHPFAKIEILISFDYFNPDQVNKGLDTFPHIGAKVFGCATGVLQRYLLKFGVQQEDRTRGNPLDFASLSSDPGSSVLVLEWTPYTRHVVSFRRTMTNIWASTSIEQRRRTFSPTSRTA